MVSKARNITDLKPVKKTDINLSRAVNIPQSVFTMNVETVDKDNDNSALVAYF